MQAAGVVPAAQGVEGDEQARLALAQRPPVVRAEADRQVLDRIGRGQPRVTHGGQDLVVGDVLGGSRTRGSHHAAALAAASISAITILRIVNIASVAALARTGSGSETSS